MYKTSQRTGLAAVLVVSACAPAGNSPAMSPEMAQAAPSADALMNQFVEAWNRDDEAALREIFADDLVLIDDGGMIRGEEAVFSEWVPPNMAATSDLQVTVGAVGAGSDLAYHSGRWSLQVTPPGAAPFTSTGSHSFVWRRGAGGEWQLVSIQIEDDPQP